MESANYQFITIINYTIIVFCPLGNTLCFDNPLFFIYELENLLYLNAIDTSY